MYHLVLPVAGCRLPAVLRRELETGNWQLF